MANERFHFDEAANAIVGTRSGAGWRLGDIVEVKLVEAAPVAGALRFEMESEPKPLRTASPGKGKAARIKAGRAAKKRR